MAALSNEAELLGAMHIGRPNQQSHELGMRKERTKIVYNIESIYDGL